MNQKLQKEIRNHSITPLITSNSFPEFNPFITEIKFFSLLEKRKQKKFKIKNRINNIIYFLINYLILLISIKSILSNRDSLRNLEDIPVSIITIKVDQTGLQEIFSPNYTGGYPSRVYVNNHITSFLENRKLNLNSINNIIQLEWDFAIVNASTMFYQRTNIIEVDLTQMYTEKLTNMSRMFAGCKRITSINLNNFQTKKVFNMVSLFSNCNSLISLDVTSFDTSEVEYMHYMFHGCTLITSIDVSNFDTRKAKDMSSMFNGCSSLTSLDISNFDTSLVRTTGHMFVHCINLVSLTLANFNTSSLEYWDNMFRNCTNLAYINLINAVENNVKSVDKILNYTMDNMVFCVNKDKIPKIVVEIEKKTCKVYSCVEDWRSVQKKIDPVTKTCINSCTETTNYRYEYQSRCYTNCPEGTFPDQNLVCQNYIETTTIPIIETTLPIITTTMPIIPTTLPIITTTMPIIPTTLSIISTTIPVIQTTIPIITTTMPIIQTTLPIIQTTLPIITTTIPHIKTTLPKITTTIPHIETTLPIITTTMPIIQTTLPIITTTILHIQTTLPIITTTVPPIETLSPSNWGQLTSTTTLKNIIIESTDNLIQKTEMKTMDKNAIITTEVKTTQLNVDDIIDKNIETQIKANEINEKLTSKTNSEFNNNILLSSILSSKISENPKCDYEKYINDKCSNINNDIISDDNFIKEIILSYPRINGKPIIKTTGNITVEITTGENQMACLNEGKCDDTLSVIDLSKCEILLRNKYHIDNSIPLIYIKTQSNSNISYEKNIQYEIYEPINKTKLDLSICQNTSVDIYIPITFTDKTQKLYDSLKNSGYDLFNPNDPFYLKICTPYKTENGTDVLLEDRKNDYYYSSINEITCQPNCHNSQYLSDSKFLKCECSITNETISDTDYKTFVPKRFYYAFYDILKYTNYKVLRCYNLAFHIDSVTINYGSIIVIIFFLFYFIAFIMYMRNGISPLKVDMMKRIFEKPLQEKSVIFNNEKPIVKNNILYKSNNNNSNSNSNRISFITVNSKENKNSKNNNNYLNKKKFQPIIFNIIPKFIPKNKKENNPPTKRKTGIVINNKQKNSNINKSQKAKTNKFNNIYNENNNNKKNNFTPIIIQKFNIIQKNTSRNNKNIIDEKNTEKGSEEIKINNESEKEKNELKYDNFELNNMEYEEALQHDKRSMVRSYWSIINREHLILLTFFSPNDFNLSYVKFARFIFLICTEMALNVFLFSDETMHKTYLSYGEYDFVQNIAQVIMTTIFSQIIEVFICYLSLTDSSIYQIKDLVRDGAQKQENLEEIFDIIKCVDNKIKAFFIFTFLLITFYWYSVACFCAVYRNTQMIFLKDCGLSFLTELLEPFILYSIPSILRAISLKCKSCSCIYKLSDMIPIF